MRLFVFPMATFENLYNIIRKCKCVATMATFTQTFTTFTASSKLEGKTPHVLWKSTRLVVLPKIGLGLAVLVLFWHFCKPKTDINDYQCIFVEGRIYAVRISK